jgi:PadR family transcriptional regulator, regulatory protein PadR
MGDQKPSYLGEFEELMLLAIMRLRDDAYGMKIRQALDEVTGRTTSIGAVYTTLERMEQKGFVTSRQGEATPERGGRAKKYFTITGAGSQALNDAQRARDLLRAGLKPAGGVI